VHFTESGSSDRVSVGKVATGAARLEGTCWTKNGEAMVQREASRKREGQHSERDLLIPLK